MTDQEIENLLIEQVKTLDLKKVALDTFNQIFTDEKTYLGGFSQDEIISKFDCFKYYIDRRYGNSMIRTRIGLYVENKVYVEDLELIGYYELETNLNGEVLDDWFVIEQEKYLKDVGIISHFQNLNENLPTDYLKRNHTQYEFVTYISLIGTLFISKQFESVGQFIKRANVYLETMDDTKLT